MPALLGVNVNTFGWPGMAFFMKSMPGIQNPCITSVDSSVTSTDRPSGTAITSGLPLVVSVAVFPLTEMPSLAYLADHCHWDPVTTSRSAGRGSMWSTLFTVTSPNESSKTMMASGAAKNVTRAPLFPEFCTGYDSSPRRLRNRMMLMMSMPQTNRNTGSASQRMMYQSLCTSCAFASRPGFTRPQPVVTRGSASRNASRSTRRGLSCICSCSLSSPGPGPLAPGPVFMLRGTISGSRGGERRDHADGDVRRAGAAAGLAGLPAGRHVVPGHQVQGDHGAGPDGQRVAAVADVDPVGLGLDALPLGVVDHVLRGLAGRQLQHHQLVGGRDRLV